MSNKNPSGAIVPPFAQVEWSRVALGSALGFAGGYIHPAVPLVGGMAAFLSGNKDLSYGILLMGTWRSIIPIGRKPLIGG